jgi:hypothetical protein
MSDILEGVVMDVAQDGMLELAVEHVEAADAGRYHQHEWVRLPVGGSRSVDGPQAVMSAVPGTGLEHRRVRCYIQCRDDQGRLVGEVEVLANAPLVEPYGLDEHGE